MKSNSNNGLGFPVLATAGTAIAASSVAGDFLKENWKWIAGIGAAGFFGWLIYDKFFSDNGNINLKYDPSFPPSSLSQLEAAAKAELLYKAMAIAGTNESLIHEALSGVTKNDFVKISKAFGKRRYLKRFGTDGLWPFGEELGLHEWMMHELTENDLAELQVVMPNVITFSGKIVPGATVFATQNKTKGFQAEKVDGIWTPKAGVEFFKKGEKIGDVIQVMKIEGVNYAVIDKNWSWKEVFVRIENLTTA